MLRINERVLDLVRFTEHPAWPSNQHVGLSAILGSRPSSRDFFLQILSLLPRAWEEGERMEWGRGVQLGRMVSTSHLLSTGGPGY